MSSRYTLRNWVLVIVKLHFCILLGYKKKMYLAIYLQFISLLCEKHLLYKSSKYAEKFMNEAEESVDI